MSKVLVLNPFVLPDNHSDFHGITFPEPSLTVQADVEQSDINYIVKQFGLTHELPYGQLVPSYDDFTDSPTDYHTAMNFVLATNETFMTMPANVRSRFNNDAGLFLDFVNAPSNYDEAIKLGLVPAKPAVEVGATAPADSAGSTSVSASGAQSST